MRDYFYLLMLDKECGNMNSGPQLSIVSHFPKIFWNNLINDLGLASSFRTDVLRYVYVQGPEPCQLKKVSLAMEILLTMRQRPRTKRRLRRRRRRNTSGLDLNQVKSARKNLTFGKVS